MDFLSLFPAHQRPNPPEALSLELSLAPPLAPPPSLSKIDSSSGSHEPRLHLWLLPAEREKRAERNSGSADTGCSSTPPPHFGGERRWGGWEAKIAELTEGTATAARWVMEKKLSATDVSSVHCRLLLTENLKEEGAGNKGPALLLEMLTAAEKAAGKEAGGLPVLLLDRRGREYPTARLKVWRSSYVLIGRWAELVRRNEMDPGDVIDVYFFRYDGGVGLAVCVRISKREEERRRGDGSEERERRRKEKTDRLSCRKRRRSSCH